MTTQLTNKEDPTHQSNFNLKVDASSGDGFNLNSNFQLQLGACFQRRNLRPGHLHSSLFDLRSSVFSLHFFAIHLLHPHRAHLPVSTLTSSVFTSRLQPPRILARGTLTPLPYHLIFIHFQSHPSFNSQNITRPHSFGPQSLLHQHRHSFSHPLVRPLVR